MIGEVLSLGPRVRAMEMTETVKRRLTAVMCADVKGYTRLMEADEAGTLKTLRSYRTAMDGLVRRHDGRIVNTWGDAVIAEFASVVEAVQCAIEIQTDLKGRNRSLPDDHQMWFRIGINLGDVMVEEDNIYGEGVNIAARLQEAAEPGGIMISGPVFDQVHHRLSVAFDRVDPQRLKNVSEPVVSYRVTFDRRRAAAESIPREPMGGSPKDGRTGETEPAGLRSAWAGLRSAWAGFADWFSALPRPVAVGLAVVALLFFINVSASVGSIWFHWPAMPILIMVLFYYLRAGRRRRGTDEKRNRRRDRC